MAVIGRMKEIHKKIFMAGSILLFIVVVYYLTNSTDEGYQAYDVNTNVSDLRYLSSLGLTTSNDSYRNALTAYRENMGREFDPNDPTPTEPIGRRTNSRARQQVNPNAQQLPRVPQGVPGPPGPQGEQGVPGPIGPIGEMGPMGETGPIGPIGETGPMGPMGDKGPIGETGPMGPMGSQGLPGMNGIDGIRGEKGEQGAMGPAGPQGAVGPAGPQGVEGPPGISPNYDSAFNGIYSELDVIENRLNIPNPRSSSQNTNPSTSQTEDIQRQIIQVRDEVQAMGNSKPYLQPIIQQGIEQAPYLNTYTQRIFQSNNQSTVLAYMNAILNFMTNANQSTTPVDVIMFLRNFLTSQGISITEPPPAEGFTNKSKKGYKDFTQRYTMLPTEYSSAL
jgi:hypothetical protein